ncbi:MAG: outer rane lipoproteinsorting protein, partial [Flavisolibacter sp.]|nr:outer rane lipoproteinsorting protein [Flavisolibacter sp.]
MKALRIALAGIATMVTFFVQAQTADEIISKHIEAIGGADAWRKVTSVKQEGTLTVQGNVQVSFVTTTLHNKGSRLDISAMGMNGYQIMTPTAGWGFMPFQGQTKPEPVTEDQVKEGTDQLDVQGTLIDYKTKGHTVTMLGKDDIDGVETFKLQVAQKSGKTETLFFDPKTYYIIRSVSKVKANGQEMDQTVNLSNYKKLPEGIVVPMSITMPQGELVISKVTINGPVDEAIF